MDGITLLAFQSFSCHRLLTTNTRNLCDDDEALAERKKTTGMLLMVRLQSCTLLLILLLAGIPDNLLVWRSSEHIHSYVNALPRY